MASRNRRGSRLKKPTGYALSQPVASQVVGMTTLEQLKQNIALARAFKPLLWSRSSQALAERVKPFATDGRFEQFKSTQVFDGPVHRRQHGFTNRPIWCRARWTSSS